MVALTERTRPTYKLSRVKRLVRNGKVAIRDNALFSAFADFGWDFKDVKDAMLKLRQKDFHKTAPSDTLRDTMLDFYKARGLKGENAYMYLYIDRRGRVVLNSCKKGEDTR